jgi:hypothetical protein
MLPKSLDPTLVSVHWLGITYATSQTMSIDLPVKRMTWNIVFFSPEKEMKALLHETLRRQLFFVKLPGKNYEVSARSSFRFIDL